MFGGRNDRLVAPPQVCQFDPISLAWTIHSGSGQVPPSRDGHSACVVDNRMFIFGGFTAAEEYENQVYCCDLINLQWTRIRAVLSGIPEAPSPRDFSCCVAWRRGFFLWGGRSDAAGHVFSGESCYDSSIYYFDADSQSWSLRARLDNVQGRRSGTMFRLGERIYFGFGFNDLRIRHEDGHLNDLWCLDPCSGSVTRAEPCSAFYRGPCPRRRLVAVPVSNSRVILFGGTCRFVRYSFQPALPAAEFQRLYAPLLARLPALRASVDDSDSEADPADDVERQESGPQPPDDVEPLEQLEEEPDDSIMGLKDLSDMFVLEALPSLQTLCALAVVRWRLPLGQLPVLLQEDVLRRFLPNVLSPP
uniref:Kelch domain-containing protein 2 n=1 Tax=Macrostomum lignano TaxID=282301 RepID=A0A1I8IBN0_9PLAT